MCDHRWPVGRRTYAGQMTRPYSLVNTQQQANECNKVVLHEGLQSESNAVIVLATDSFIHNKNNYRNTDGTGEHWSRWHSRYADENIPTEKMSTFKPGTLKTNIYFQNTVRYAVIYSVCIMCFVLHRLLGRSGELDDNSKPVEVLTLIIIIIIYSS